MLGDTLTLPAPGGNIVCTKINQDGYSSEYLKVGASSKTRVRVRHTVTGAKNGAPAYDRHNIEVVTSFYEGATGGARDVKVYMVMEGLPSDETTLTDILDGLCDFLVADADAVVAKLVGWES